MTDYKPLDDSMQHECADGITYIWVPRVPEPKSCPRCKARLDKTFVEGTEPEDEQARR